MCRHLCKLCKKTFQLKIELIIHERKDHGAMKDNQIPEIPQVNISKLLVSSHETRPENWSFNKHEARTSTSTSASPFPISAEGASSTNHEIQTHKKVTFKLTSSLGVLPQMPVVIKTESRESDKSLNREWSSQRNTQSIGIHPTDNSKMACDKDILTTNNKNSNEVVSVEDEVDDVIAKIVSSESLSSCEASTFITGDVLDILRTKKKRKSTPCKMNEVKKRFLRSQSGCLNVVCSNVDNSHVETSRSDAGCGYGSLITCVSCSKTVRNSAKLVLHLRKYHSRVQTASMMRKRNSVTSESSINSTASNVPVIVYQKPSILKRWRCKKCGKHFDRHVKLWKHRIQTCGLVFRSNNAKPTALILQESVENTSSYYYVSRQPIGKRYGLPHLTPTNTESDSTSENMDIIDISDDVNLIKCPWQDCKLFFADRIQLATHAQEFHNIFMCRLCESVMLSISQRDVHYLKVHNNLEEHSVNRELTKQAGSKDQDPDKCFVVTTGAEILPKNAFPIVREISTVERSIAVVDGGGNIEPNSGIRRHHSKYSDDEFEGGVRAQPKVLIRQIDSLDCGRPPTPGTSDSIGSRTKHNEAMPLIKPKQLMTCSLCNSSFFQTRLYLKHKKECRGKLTNPTIPNSSNYPNEALALSDIRSKIVGQSSNQANKSRVNSSVLDASTRPSRSGISSLKCDGCSQTFRNSNSLQSHVQEASCRNKIYQYECEYCHQGFSRDASLKNHVNSQHTESTTDDSCDKKADTVMKSEKNTQCKLCERRFTTVRGLSSHMRIQHPLNLRNVEPSLEKSADSTIAEMHRSKLVSRSSSAGACSDGRSANQKRPLSYNSNPGSSRKIARVGPLHEPRSSSNHFETHQKYQSELQLKCNECGDTFNERDKLAQHLLDHNEVKSSPKILRGVRKTGTALSQPDLEKLHNCVICGGLFLELNDMILHVDAEHSRKGRYACMECEKIFSVAMELVIHSQTHKNRHGSPIISEPQKKNQTKRKDKVFHGGIAITCPKCNLEFNDNPTFRVHWQNHWDAQEILYPCSNADCKQTFSSLSLLNRHVEQAHPEVTVLVCTFPGCEIPFTHSLGLRRHLRDDHNITGTNTEHKPSPRTRVRSQQL